MLAVSLFGYAVTVGLFPFLDAYAALAVLRFFDGAFSVGVWVSAETILLARSGAHNKALITSLYAIVLAVGYVVGPGLSGALATLVPLQVGFLVSAVIACAAAAYVALRLERESLPYQGESSGTHSQGAPATSPALKILWRIKTSCFATFAYGYFQASVVLFLPLYLMESKAIMKEQTIVIPAFFAAGMLLFASYAGRLGDRFGHLLVMRILAGVGTIMIGGFVFLDSYAMMCGAVFFAGASLASISPVSLALQGVVSPPEDISRATAIYNAFYAVGMLIGPPISSYLFARISGPAMLYHLAGLWASFLVFAFIFQRDDPAVSRRRQAVAVRELGA
jgi:MFS family permease